MNQPRRPRLPRIAPDPPPPHRPDPRFRPDERKEGGPDFGKEALQHEKAHQDRQNAAREAEVGPPTAKER